MKGTSRFGLAIAAAILMGALPLSAKAADLGGDCCADLEERIAELEATTVRKGNRKVSLELSGQVDRMLLFWNDGVQSDVYSVDNSYSSTRFRLKGTGQMLPGWKAGFYQEIEFRDAASNTVNQVTETGTRGTDSSTGALRLRQSNVFVESEKYGRATIGLQNMATKDLTLINLGGGLSDPENYYATSFGIRGTILGVRSGVNWGNLSNALDGLRLEGARYDSPSIYGFILSVFWGQNDVWDIALRYQKEWNSIRVAGGIGYAYYGEMNCGVAGNNNTNLNGTCLPTNENAAQGIPNVPGGPGTKTEVVSGDISVMHIPTGLYVTFVAGTRHLTNPFFNAAGFLVPNNDASYFYVQAGVTKRIFDVGATTFYGEFGNYQDFAVGDILGLVGAAGQITSSDTTRWGVGFTQAYDGAALEIYVNYLHYSANIDAHAVVDVVGVAPSPIVKAATEDWDAVYTGARLKF